MAQPVDMAGGSVAQGLSRLALPLMVSLFFQNLYAYVDTIYVSWLGETALAAVSLAVPLTYVSLSFAKGVAMGSVVLMSFARGAGDEASVKQISFALLPLMIGFMLLFFPLMIPAVCQNFYRMLGADANTTGQGIGFTFWLVAGFPVMGYVMAVEALFMAQGDTVTPMKGMILGNVCNILLEPIFIFALGWGTTGAAIGTLTGQCVAALYMRRQSRLAGQRLRWVPARGMFLVWKKILGQGMFVSLSYLISPLALIMLNRILSQFGPTAIGAWNLMSRTEMMVMLPVMGLGNALATFTGFNLGRLNYDRIKSGLKVFSLISWGIVTPLMGLFLLFPYQIISLFRPAESLLDMGAQAIQASGVSGLFVPVMYALAGMSQGTKRPAYMMGMMFVYLICLRIPLATAFADRWGVSGVFWSHPAATAAAALLAAFFLWRLLASCRQRIENDKAKLDQEPVRS